MISEHVERGKWGLYLRGRNRTVTVTFSLDLPEDEVVEEGCLGGGAAFRERKGEAEERRRLKEDIIGGLQFCRSLVFGFVQSLQMCNCEIILNWSCFFQLYAVVSVFCCLWTIYSM